MRLLLTSLVLGMGIQLSAQINEFFDRAAGYGHLSGVVLIQRGDKTLFEGCYGFAEPGREPTLDTPFDIGSLTKQFTATAILQLVEAGLLRPDDPVNAHLGPLASRRWKQVTIHHLLTHTSGIPSVYQTEQGLDVFLPETRPVDPAELIGKFRDAKLRSKPGEEFNYSNSGYILLAAIIERVSGLSYDRYLQERLFTPYGLRSASFGASADAALPYYGFGPGRQVRAPVHHASWFVGAGGVYASANDLARWTELLSRDSVLSTDLRELLFEPHARAGDRAYGYGWQIAPDGTIAHDGANAGFVSQLSFSPVTGERVILLTNRGFADIHQWSRSAEQVAGWSAAAWQWLRGDKLDPLPQRTADLPASAHYRLPDGRSLHLQAGDSTVAVTLTDGCPARIVAHTPIAGDEAAVARLRRIADLLARHKFWQIAKFCDGEMKFVAYIGLLRIGLRMMEKRVGEVRELVPYRLEAGHGLIRMIGSEGTQDMIVYFDPEGRIQGLFEHGRYAPERALKMTAYPVGTGRLYLDGFPYAEESAFLQVDSTGLEFEQYGRTVRGELVASH